MAGAIQERPMRAHVPGLPLLGVLLLGLLLPCLGGLAGSARAEDGAAPAVPALSLTERLGHLRPGRLIRTRGANVLLLKLSPAYQPGLRAHVGLGGVKATSTHLPGPAGEWHVRIANRLPEPLLVPAGEVLLTPQGPSRMVERPVWIPRGSATFVPVVQVDDPAPAGPYVHRGNLLTPVERSLEDLDDLRARIRFRNAAFGVQGHRADDAGAAYQSATFKARLPAYVAELAGAADGKLVVGVLVVGERGAQFAHVETDASRFQTLWPRLLEAIALDAMLVQDANLAANPADLSEVLLRARVLLDMLEAPPLTRTNFGRGEENLWVVPGRDEVWKGLTLDGKPVSLTMLGHPSGAAANGAPVPPAGPGPGGTGNPETPVVPGRVELERRGPRTPFEQRLRDRRRGTPTPGGGSRS